MMHSHGYAEPMIMAYPCAEGFFISMYDPPLPPKPPGACCGPIMERSRIKPNHFRFYPTADLPDAVTEIGSGSSCQNSCYKSFRYLIMIWTTFLALFFILMIFLGLYYYSELKVPEKDLREEVIKSSPVFEFLLEYGPVVTFFVSFVLLLIPCLGFFGAYKENTWLLVSYCFLLFTNSLVKMVAPPRNPFLAFSVTLLIMILPFAITCFIGKKMSRAI